jgi:hypothetical protein
MHPAPETPPHGPEIDVGAIMVKCAECATPFAPARAGQRFCNPTKAKVSPCARRWGARNLGRGSPVVPLLQAWGATRHAKAGTREADINRYARRELTTIARLYNDEDAAEGRADALAFVGTLMDQNSMFIDRKR